MAPPPYHPHLLFPPNVYCSTPVGDAVSNLISSNTKSLQYLVRSLPSLTPLAVLSLIHIAMGTALFLLHIATGLVEPRFFCAATVVLNHIFHLLLYCLVLDSPCLAIFGHSFTIFRPLISSFGGCPIIGTPQS